MADKISENKNFAASIKTSIRVVISTIIICCACYTLIIFGAAQIFTPHTANGSLLISDNGTVIGSSLIAQNFSKEKYFHPRPSATSYNAMASGGSNLSPASPLIKEKAKIIIGQYGASTNNPIPADLVSASGSGLDPHISVEAAMFQVPRIAEARNISDEDVINFINDNIEIEDFITGKPLINVLKLNIALDKMSTKSE